MSNLFESDVEYYNPTPKPQPKGPKKSAETLISEVMMWKARARQNQAETRAVRAETAAAISKANHECAKLRKRLEAAQLRLAEMEVTNDE